MIRTSHLLAVALLFSGVARAETRSETWHDAARNRDVPVKLYLPAHVAADTRVVIFSPGLGGTRDGYAYLGEGWSDQGYAVLVLQHVGSDFAHLRDPAAMTPLEYVARVNDVRFALNQLQRMRDTATDALAGKLDLKRVAMAGHSYGGVTTEAMAGQVATVAGKEIALSDPRIACAIIMSPSPPRQGDAKLAFAKIKMPLLHLTGTDDVAAIGGTTAADRRVPFDSCPATPQYLITFKDGDHMVFSGRRAQTPAKATLYDVVHPIILETTTKFLNANLRGDAEAATWLKEKLTSTIGALGVVETK